MNLDVLNPEQREAVVSTDGPLLIFAGAGSGKTRVICYRMAYLIEEKGVEPGEILAVTFTNKAASEMKERVEKLTGLSVASMWVSTFHSAAVRILRRDYPSIGGSRDFTIYDDGDSETLLKNIIRDAGYDPKVEKPALYSAYIGRAKDELQSPDRWIEKTRISQSLAERVHLVYGEYQKRLRAANALDFGDLLVEAVRLLETPEVLERYQDRFRYVLVDEYQDTNTAQSRMIELLAAKRRNLCVVGDDDQSIYEWRGADRRNILTFEKNYPEAKVIVLNRNYRSTQPILDVASNLIGFNTRSREKKLVTDRSDGARPEAINVATEYKEVENIIDEIRRNVRAGEKLADHAVFFRVHAQSRVIEEVMSASGMPYQLLSGVSFYQRSEIKDVMAYLRLIANPRDNLALRRVINNPARGIGETTLARLALAIPEKPFFEALAEVDSIPEIKPGTRSKIAAFRMLILGLAAESKELGIAELLREVLERTKYLEQYNAHDTEEESRIENVRELLSVTQEFQASTLDPSVEAFLERSSLAAEIDNLDPAADAVPLLTLHAAKGLEFKHVFIVGCEESLFPHSRVYNEGSNAALEEERRLAYVGCTRAMDTLRMYFANERRIYGRLVSNLPSRFLKEAGLEVPHARVSRISALTDSILTRTATPTVRVANAALPGAFSEGESVRHHKFGLGIVIHVSESGDDNEVLRIRFPGGVKDLMSRYAQLTKI